MTFSLPRRCPSLVRFLAAFAATVTVTLPCLAVDRTALLEASNSITATDLKAHVDVLADDSFEGRGAGTRGGQAAGMYVLRQLEQRGLKGGGDNGGYFQSFGGRYRNVLGLLEGSDSELKSQVIVIGGHYDHVGYGTRRNSYGPYGYVHNGADDNASGAAGLLEVADAFLKLPAAPRRSILFAFWDAEEAGLLGSKHFVSYPTVPISNIEFMINVDMIGRLRRQLEVFGSRTAPGLRRLVAESNFETAIRLDFNWELKANSDHHPFANRGVPVLMFHTGLHDDYHRPSDDAHKVNEEGMQQVSRLLFRVTADLADREQLPGFRTAGRHETPRHKQQLERHLEHLKPRLGVRWRNDDQGEGLLLAYVAEGSAAERAGLQTGDRILEFDGEPIENTEQFRSLVLHAVSPTPAVVLKRDADAATETTIELDGHPTRIGISWREDEAARGSVLLTRVVTGSPAQQAGLQLRDRIYEIGGQSFGDGEELLEQLVTLPGPIELTIERDGRLQAATLDVPPPRQSGE
jgi:hypothetical protein